MSVLSHMMGILAAKTVSVDSVITAVAITAPVGAVIDQKLVIVFVLVRIEGWESQLEEYRDH
jgi:hypothetical protein